MARNVHNKTGRYLSHGCTYAFSPLVHGRGYLRYWKNLVLQLATLEVSNQSYWIILIFLLLLYESEPWIILN